MTLIYLKIIFLFICFLLLRDRSPAQCPFPLSISTINSVCAQSNGTISVEPDGTGPFAYSIDGGFTYLPNSLFSGLSPGIYNIHVRNSECILAYSVEITGDATNTWTGAINEKWEEPGNWSCHSLPTESTDVIINFGYVVVRSNVTVNSISIANDTQLSVETGYNMKINH